MMLALAGLLHGEGQDIIYFWSSILIVALPLTVFGVLTYLVVKAYRQRGQDQP
jgi:heme/copper-type cytochrome/quinol oxidase subunit 2